jgi:hypothetical protein
MENFLNELIDDFIFLFNDDIKQHDKNWVSIIGTTIGGSEISALLGINPYVNKYKLIELKTNICKGINVSVETLPCWWGTIFEKVITKVLKIDLGNEIKGTNICIQKYEGHRNSPDGYMVLNLYKKDDIYHIWTTDKPKELIDLSVISLLEFKCPIKRKINNYVPPYYIPQVLSGLSVSPIALIGLFVDAMFKKCSLYELGFNEKYDSVFHMKHNINQLPLAFGIIPIYVNKNNINFKVIELYKVVFKQSFDITNNKVIDIGNISIELFDLCIKLIHEKKLITKLSSVKFYDNRGDNNINEFDKEIDNHKLFALFPWKLFDLLYYPINREVNFIENLLPLIQEVILTVKENVNNNYNTEKLKILDMCNAIYS